MSGAGDRLPEWLLKTAVERGAKHYQREFDPSLPPDNPVISDEEIGVALTLGEMPDDPWFVRAAAQLLSSRRVDPQRLARLAVMERVEPVLLHISVACERAGEASEPWATLRRQLHPRRTIRADALPHWTRFAILPGLMRNGRYAPPNGLNAMNNPLVILQTLDRHLDHSVELTIYGRAAIALGFPAHELRHEAFRSAQPKVLALVVGPHPS